VVIDRIQAKPPRRRLAGADALDLTAFCRPEEYLFVLSAMADLSGSSRQLMMPGNLMAVGERLGGGGAKLAARRPAFGRVRAPSAHRPHARRAKIGEHAKGCAVLSKLRFGQGRDARECCVVR
jgi:hypothetical protein